MTRAVDLKSDIDAIISSLVELGACTKFNFPGIRAKSLTTESVGVFSNSSFPLRDVPYLDVYQEIIRTDTYTLMTIDGGLFIIYYELNRNVISHHRLCFFPSPDISPFQQEPEVYEGEAIYAEVLSRRIVPFPIRFDFNLNVAPEHAEAHPNSHLTLGQYSGCRIPVDRALRPIEFLEFILKSFFNTFFASNWVNIAQCTDLPNRLITRTHQTSAHFVVGA